MKEIGRLGVTITLVETAPHLPAAGSLAIRKWENHGLEVGTHTLRLGDADGLEPFHARQIAEVMDEGDGFWKPCSGCQEGVDGYVSQEDYPFNPTFRCQPGGGCSECGGLGVVWDNTDYDALTKAMLADLEADDSDQPSAFIVWNAGRTEGVIFTDLDREPGEPSAEDDATTASLGVHGSISSVLAEAFNEAFEDDIERPIERIALEVIRRNG